MIILQNRVPLRRFDLTATRPDGTVTHLNVGSDAAGIIILTELPADSRVVTRMVIGLEEVEENGVRVTRNRLADPEEG